ncbi:PAS domain S-box protein [Methanoculleus sp. 7T]|uniref:PAS domain S-box protein n=1 Tax=Methanoculleus sp. 7T TaxID=2937282 RepID=UPI0020BDEE04|nr:PAS domain S-box protein [Methanoculleus sp. 7T]MCK8519759.1 PAS domain S-box protein [Methanoculleus sp. 7T]
MHECTPACDDTPALSAVMDALDEGLLVISPDNRVACINRRLRHILGIDRGVLCGTDADQFVRQDLAPRICEEPCRAEVIACLSDRCEDAEFLCTLRSADGGEERFRCSCRSVREGPFPGMRLIRLCSDPQRSEEVQGHPIHRSSADAAERRRIEEVLRESENKYQFLIENLNEGVWLVDTRGVTVFVNRKMADILGYPVAEMIGAPVFAFVDEEGAGPAKEHLRRLGEGTREVFEFEFVHKSGARISVLMATAPIIGADGVCRGSLAGVLDVTSQKRMEAQLRESEEKYRSLVELSAEATLIHRDGKIAYINPAGMRLLGALHPEEVIGKAVFDIVHSGARGRLGNLIVRDLQGEETPLVELQVVRLDGTTVPVEGRGTRTIFEGRPAVQVVMRDITQRKYAEEQLQASNRYLMLLNRIIGTSASAHSPGELLETALTQTLDLLGYDGGAIYSLNAGESRVALQCRRNISEGCLERAESVLDELCAGLPRYLERRRGPETADCSRLLREFEFTALACIPLIVESDVVGALLVGRRVRESFSPGERAILEAVGREIGAGILRGMLYRRLEAANMEANLYLDILTHDIRNADNVANTYADLLIDELEGEPARHAKKLKDGIRKSIEITANVATIRRIHENRVELRPIDLHTVILDEIAHFPDLRIRYDGQPEAVLADDLLTEVFTNLIGNAAKHGGPDVEVTVTVEDHDDGTVVVTVADTGPGVPDEIKEGIFYRFERESGRRGSQGLGLSICRMLVMRYGGRIWVDDRVAGRPEEGAAFRFTLRKAGSDRKT